MLILLGCAPCAFADNGVSSNAPPTTPRYSLWQTINLALKQNPDVLIAKKKVEEAAGSVMEARAGFLPSLGTWDSYEKFQPEYASLNGASPNNRNEIWNVSVRLTETAFAGGAVRGKMSIARLNQQSRLLDYQATVNRVIMDVRVAFYEVLKDKSGITVHQQAVEFLQKQLDYERQRIQVGNGQKLNALRAEVDLSLEQSALIESQNLWRNSYLRLSELLAIAYPVTQTQTPFEAAGELETAPFALTEQDCLSAAMERRPELKARANDVEAQRKQYVVDRAGLLPHVDLFLGYDVVSEPDRTLPDDYYKGYVAGVGVNWNIFDGFATEGRMRATRARIDEARMSHDALRNSVQTEVVLAFHDLQRARETMESQRENVDLAAQSQELAGANFQQGLIAQLDLLQSQLDLTRARTVELEARFDYNTALARLERAMGSDFRVSESGKETK
jgi:outer membrane protein